jgi:hypothetical protein
MTNIKAGDKIRRKGTTGRPTHEVRGTSSAFGEFWAHTYSLATGEVDDGAGFKSYMDGRQLSDYEVVEDSSPAPEHNH